MNIEEHQIGASVFIDGDFKRTIVVGDIHGCFIELKELLEKINFTHEDLLISLGDVVNRGPYPIQTLHFFRNTPNAYLIRGNHEWRLLDLLQGKGQAKWSEEITLSEIPPNDKMNWIRFLGSTPSLIQTPGIIATHALLSPELGVNHQIPEKISGYDTSSGSIPKDCNTIPFWYHEWRKNWPDEHRTICIGHDEYANIELEPKKLYALDTKVAKGEQLTAVIFPSLEIVQIAARRNYHLTAKYGFYLNLVKTNPTEVPIDILSFFEKNEQKSGLIERLAEQALWKTKIGRIAQKTDEQFGKGKDIDLSVLRQLAQYDLRQRIRFFTIRQSEFSAKEILALFPPKMKFCEVDRILEELAV